MNRQHWTRAAAILLGLAASGAAAAAPVLDFKFTYPPQVAAIAPLRAWFDQERDRLRDASTAEAAADQRDAVQSGRSFHPYETDRTWKVVTDTPRFLSLSVESYDYTGGAHGDDGFGTLVWDKKTQQRRTSLSFFVSPAALRAALSPAFCRKLDDERRAKRSGDNSGMLPEFTQCIDPTRATVILGSSGRVKFNRIGVLVAPYGAGPYAEGTYEVTSPVTPAIIATVRPEFRPYFAIGTP